MQRRTTEPVTITAPENGPYLVTGPFVLKNADRTEYEAAERAVAAEG